jgi:LuxR family maltose regulon positive regulatory protein
MAIPSLESQTTLPQQPAELHRFLRNRLSAALYVSATEKTGAPQAAAWPADLPDPETVTARLEEMLPFAGRSGSTELHIEVLILLALVAQAARDSQRALLRMRQALALAEACESGTPIRNPAPPAFRQTVPGAPDAGEEPPPAAEAPGPARRTVSSARLIEPLSSREMDVLRLMACGDSNAEIARKLVITLNTTKKHVTHIFDKLEVTNRSKAVIRARDLGMKI